MMRRDDLRAEGADVIPLTDELTADDAAEQLGHARAMKREAKKKQQQWDKKVLSVSRRPRLDQLEAFLLMPVWGRPLYAIGIVSFWLLVSVICGALCTSQPRNVFLLHFPPFLSVPLQTLSCHVGHS